MITVEENYQLSLLDNGGWDPRIEVVEVGGFVRSHIIYAQGLSLVYDTLLGPLSGGWLAQRVAQRAPDKPVTVVVSHSDWDHCWGNQCFDGPILALEKCAERIVGAFGQAELTRKAQEHPSYQAVRRVAPNQLLRQEMTLEGGDLTFQLLHTRGHRPDHLAIYIPEIATLLAGDAVETPFALLDDEESPIQNLRDMQNTLKRFLGLPVQWLLCNHAPPQRGSELVRQNLAYYQELCRLAQECPTYPELESRFPYPGPDDDSYRSEHERIRRAAWQAFQPSTRP